MSSVAFCLGPTIIYWDSILIALAVPACYLALAGAYAARAEKRAALFLLTPLGVLLSLFFSRLIYWTCHPEQFASFPASFLPGAGGGYCLSGVLIGFLLAALLLRLCGLVKDLPLLLDCAAPGLALGMAVLRLSSLFNDSCRGKTILRDPRLFRLPFGVPEGGGTEYRFAFFFLGSLLFVLFFFLLLWRDSRIYGPERTKRKRRGDVFLSFLLLYSAEELVVDSARNDASYFLFNAFISVAQIVAAATLLVVLLIYGVRAIRRHGAKLRILVCFFLWIVGLSVVGVCEYLVQRHGNWQLSCYTAMSLAILVVLFSTTTLRRLSERRKMRGASL